MMGRHKQPIGALGRKVFDALAVHSPCAAIVLRKALGSKRAEANKSGVANALRELQDLGLAAYVKDMHAPGQPWIWSLVPDAAMPPNERVASQEWAPQIIHGGDPVWPVGPPCDLAGLVQQMRGRG
jgi:hypothetical protein